MYRNLKTALLAAGLKPGSSARSTLVLLLAALATPVFCAELSVEDFQFDGEMGSAGSPSGTKKQMRNAGGILAKCIAEYWKGTK